ncbi:MAG: glycine--tRNA ligase subunit beta [Fimbriimonadaceae bacterium]
MPELLLEVGCEELPATFVRKAYTELQARIGHGLAELYGRNFDGQAAGTPRRLIVDFADLPARQPDTTKDVRGPALKAAYDGDGNPTQALLGFCRSNGVEPTLLRRDEQYVWLTKQIVGRPTSQLLGEVLPEAIKGLSFDKSMRWGAGRLRFARPIRWILAAYDGEPIAFEIEGVVSGLKSRGHRFYAPDEFSARTLSELVEGLRERLVEVDVDRRIACIVEQAKSVTAGAPQLPDDLVDENAFLTEWPTAVAGEFRAEHLHLPGPVLTTAMAKHEKMFPVRDVDGKLVNRFIFIRNSGVDATVRKGAEWVLNARLDDAQFFFKEDAKHDLDYFLEKTSGIVFQEKLGTVRERANRLETLSASCALHGYIDPQQNRVEQVLAAQAGKYAKADLSTGLVGDMASLQGIVGAEYANRQGFPEPVCWAIASQYDHAKNLGPDCEGGRVASYVAVADQVDKLAGFLGLGLVPTGSSDPYGLRRATQVLVDIALAWPHANIWQFDLLLGQAVDGYGTEHALNKVKAVEALKELFLARYTVHFAGVRHDMIAAATTDDVASPQLIRNRLNVLKIVAEDAAFVQAAVRPINLVEAEKRKGWKPGPTELANTESFFYASALPLAVKANADGAPQLAAVCDDFVKKLYELDRAKEFNSEVVAQARVELTQPMKVLQGAVNSFLDTTLVNDKDPVVRNARLQFLDHVACRLKALAGDLTKLVTDGAAPV